MTAPTTPPTAGPAQGAPEGTPAPTGQPTGAPTDPATSPATDPAQGTDTTDWKAEARKWETRAKANNKAAEELEQARAASMSDTEKATADAEKRGRLAAAIEYGGQIAQAKFEAAAAAKGVDLGEAADLINVTQFVDPKTGAVDDDAIKKAVGRLAKVVASTPQTPGRSGAEFTGGSGAPGAITEEQLARMTPDQIAKAHADGKLAHLL